MCKKKSYEAYGEALGALYMRVQRPELGSVYECPECEAWHISSRRFTVIKGAWSRPGT